MENIGRNNEVFAGGKTFHIQTQYLEPAEKVVANIFEQGKVIFSRGVDVKNLSVSEIKAQVNQLHHYMTEDMELIFYIAEKVHTIRHSASTNKLGIVFLKRNLFDEAVREFRKAIEIDPEYIEAYNNLGYTLLKQELYEEAIDTFVKGIKKDGNYADLHHNLGYAYFSIDKYGEAIREINNAIEINEDYVAAIFSLCLVYLKSGDNENQDCDLAPIPERIEKIKQLLTNVKSREKYYKPQSLDTVLEHLEKDNINGAIKVLEQASHELQEFMDKYLESEFYLKFMFGGKGKDDDFIRDYSEQLRQAIEKYPGYADLRNNLGIAYLIQCRNLFLSALEEFREALKINPEFKKAAKNLKLAENDGKGFLILLRAILK